MQLNRKVKVNSISFFYNHKHFEALICFDYTYGKYCDLFDGEAITWTFTTFVPHAYGSLGFYEGNPTTVGSRYVNGHRKVETLTSSGWTSLPDHPKYVI